MNHEPNQQGDGLQCPGSVRRPHELQLRVRAWPTGEGQVTIICEPEGQRTRVTMVESPTAGPALWVPRPALDLILGPRNTEALKRLAYLAEAGSSPE